MTVQTGKIQLSQSEIIVLLVDTTCTVQLQFYSQISLFSPFAACTVDVVLLEVKFHNLDGKNAVKEINIYVIFVFFDVHIKM